MHTPGPWECSIYCDNVSWHYRLFAKETDLTAKANAQLISAAPDLLSALETCLKNSEMRRASGFESGPMIDREIEIARAAIAKATGKTD